MTLPNFFLIGAMKSGTTSLYKYLGQHPEVFVCPVKEPRFFGLEGANKVFSGPGDGRVKRIKSLEEYERLFDGVAGEKSVGEGSTGYLVSERAAERIKARIPEARIIAILRNPADRAFSAYLHMLRKKREPVKDFRKALAAEDKRKRDNWSPSWYYRRLGLYHNQLLRYYNLFDKGQIKILLYEEFKEKPVSVLKDVFGFLGVDGSFCPDVSRKYNVSVIPRNRLINRALNLKTVQFLKPVIPSGLRRAVRDINTLKPEMPDDVRAGLMEEYREDILKLQDLTGRDFSVWLSK